jgi:hypothetical protein
MSLAELNDTSLGVCIGSEGRRISSHRLNLYPSHDKTSVGGGTSDRSDSTCLSIIFEGLAPLGRQNEERDGSALEKGKKKICWLVACAFRCRAWVTTEGCLKLVRVGDSTA